jgi:uncharacterized protein (TIGR00730 family)
MNLQTWSDSYQLASLDSDFLSGDSTRGIRFYLEYEKPEQRLRAWGVTSTIVVIGSARAGENGDHVSNSVSSERDTERLPRVRWYEQARQFGRVASERGGALTTTDGLRHNVIATGGGPGIMEAANRGASDIGAPSIGFNIQLPHKQAPNSYSTPELTFQFYYFAMRKLHLAKRARALVVFPGGFGTLDELFEILNLVKTRRAPPIPIVCFDQRYWTEVINFQSLADNGMIAPFDLEMLSFADDVEEAWRALVSRGLPIG